MFSLVSLFKADTLFSATSREAVEGSDDGSGVGDGEDGWSVESGITAGVTVTLLPRDRPCCCFCCKYSTKICATPESGCANFSVASHRRKTSGSESQPAVGKDEEQHSKRSGHARGIRQRYRVTCSHAHHMNIISMLTVFLC